MNYSKTWRSFERIILKSWYSFLLSTVDSNSCRQRDKCMRKGKVSIVLVQLVQLYTLTLLLYTHPWFCQGPLPKVDNTNSWNVTRVELIVFSLPWTSSFSFSLSRKDIYQSVCTLLCFIVTRGDKNRGVTLSWLACRK